MPLRARRERPGRAALLTDVDGTLAEIVADRATAHPVPDAVVAGPTAMTALLAELAEA